MGQIKISILYLCLHNLLKKRHGIGEEITRKELFCELGKHFLVPKKVKPLIIKEMEELKLLKKQTNGAILILKCEYDLEKDANMFYEQIGLF